MIFKQKKKREKKSHRGSWYIYNIYLFIIGLDFDKYFFFNEKKKNIIIYIYIVSLATWEKNYYLQTRREKEGIIELIYFFIFSKR